MANWSGITKNITTKVGTASATTANRLIDTTLSPFVVGDIGRKVQNTTDNTYATITAYNSTSNITISDDIMVNGEGYSIGWKHQTKH